MPLKDDDDDVEDYVFVKTSDTIPNRIDRILSPLPIPIAPKKKLLWQLEYKSVPYYVRYYNNQLFVCDKYGSILFLIKPFYCKHHEDRRKVWE